MNYTYPMVCNNPSDGLFCQMIFSYLFINLCHKLSLSKTGVVMPYFYPHLPNEGGTGLWFSFGRFVYTKGFYVYIHTYTCHFLYQTYQWCLQIFNLHWPYRGASILKLVDTIKGMERLFLGGQINQQMVVDVCIFGGHFLIIFDVSKWNDRVWPAVLVARFF